MINARGPAADGSPTRMLVMARRFEKMIPIPTRSERVIWWVRHFCIASGGTAHPARAA